MSHSRRLFKRIATVLTCILILFALIAGFRNRGAFLVTADQHGQRLLDRGEFDAAAEVFEDPFRRAVALSRTGDFKRAASMFSTIPGPEAAFNHANMLVMLGEYEPAVKRYDRALELRPDWQPAVKNRAIAAGRAARLKTEGGEMTGGKLGADEIVFDQTSSSSNSSDDNEETVKGESLSDSELQAIWLRQVQTTPRDFLKSKFSFQEAMRDQEPADDE
ncbi:tetratricopeptide repeat protein [Rubripirellula reticaptiva]|uniref:Tetratricopeptide repeat protein n=1 Tax=Rubripirellula reticaptiva TaxID=2528013 RepID=A0A5C6F6V0_9BACT|nr:tetratricopeptide repeat protein [Rubripirellula reticaptiva]TWU56310.1 Tetratricopeptide repeat protein [Rubripirellula reticaptiva]